MAKDYYATLGLNKEASPEEIKRAFRKLAVEHHPDHGGDAERFKEINEAYSILSNPQKRQGYDNPHAGGFNFEEFFGFRRPRRGPQPDMPQKGPEIRMEIDVPLHIFILGGNITTNINFEEACGDCSGRGASEFEPCSVCNGAGFIEVNRKQQNMFIKTSHACFECKGTGKKPLGHCETCGGTGKTNVEHKELNFEIIPGARDGHIVVRREQGRRGVFGGPRGDVLIKLNMVMPNPEELTDEQKEVLQSI